MLLKYEVIDNKYFNIKEVLKSYFQISDRLLTRLKKHERIFLNGKPSYVTNSISIGDIITVDMIFDEDSDNVVPIKIDLDILYEDKYMIVVNKSANMPVHPTTNHYSDSLSNGIKFYFNSINLKRKIRPVNRLDRDTTGIVIFAKNEYIQESLVRQIKTKDFIKEYIAILDGHLETRKGTISASISRKQGSIIEREINSQGETAITHYEVIKYFDNFTLVKFILETGRTHQIRVHSKYIGHPIVGDTLYGKQSELINRQSLHSNKVTFIHPISKIQITIESEIPDDMRKIKSQNCNIM